MGAVADAEKGVAELKVGQAPSEAAVDRSFDSKCARQTAADCLVLCTCA